MIGQRYFEILKIFKSPFVKGFCVCVLVPTFNTQPGNLQLHWALTSSLHKHLHFWGLMHFLGRSWALNIPGNLQIQKFSFRSGFLTQTLIPTEASFLWVFVLTDFVFACLFNFEGYSLPSDLTSLIDTKVVSFSVCLELYLLELVASCSSCVEPETRNFCWSFLKPLWTFHSSDLLSTFFGWHTVFSNCFPRLRCLQHSKIAKHS
jgi:hypothetical protein